MIYETFNEIEKILNESNIKFHTGGGPTVEYYAYSAELSGDIKIVHVEFNVTYFMEIRYEPTVGGSVREWQITAESLGIEKNGVNTTITFNGKLEPKYINCSKVIFKYSFGTPQPVIDILKEFIKNFKQTKFQEKLMYSMMLKKLKTTNRFAEVKGDNNNIIKCYSKNKTTDLVVLCEIRMNSIRFIRYESEKETVFTGDSQDILKKAFDCIDKREYL